MRNPVYLDLELVQNVADYEGVTYAVDTDITERGTSTTSGGAKGGFGGFGAHLDKGSAKELQQSYKVPANPFRVMNDVLDLLENRIVSAEDEDAKLTKGALVSVEGSLNLTSTSEVGTLLGRIMPAMAASGGGEMTDEIKADIFSGMVQGNKKPTKQLYRFSDAVAERTVIVPIEADYFFRGNSYDELDNELTVVGVIDRFVSEGESYSLEKWLMPDMDRAMRRALKGRGLDRMLEGLRSTMDVDIDSAKTVLGPALEIRPMVIY